MTFYYETKQKKKQTDFFVRSNADPYPDFRRVEFRSTKKTLRKYDLIQTITIQVRFLPTRAEAARTPGRGDGWSVRPAWSQSGWSTR